MPDTQKTTEKPSVRAANELERLGLLYPSPGTADIIARETGCDELLEACKRMVKAYSNDQLFYECECERLETFQAFQKRIKQEAVDTIAKAEGGGQ